ncbi:MAG: hypothetical protein EB168_08960 [Euryarchaeota archaeon]|nr:hypothetical protein [Euryarchaeota archaeon]
MDPDKAYFLEQAKRGLKRATVLAEQGRRAAAQHALRDAHADYYKLGKDFTDSDFQQEFNQLFDKLYAGL